jgi:hypothetical protein
MKKKSVTLLISLFLLGKQFGFSQTPNVTVLNGGYFQVEYGCLDQSSLFVIDFPSYKVTGLTKDMTYSIVTTQATIFDHVEYNPIHFNKINDTQWKWESDVISTDSVYLVFQGTYSNWQIDASQWFTFRIGTPYPYRYSYKNVNVSIVAPYPAIEVSGSSLPCTNPVSFNLTNLPTYTTTTWVIKQGTTTKASGSGTTATANNLSNGSGEVTFTVYFDCNLNPLTFKKDFWLGKPILNSVTGPGTYPYEGCTNTEYSFSVSPFHDPLSQGVYTWSIIPSNGYIYPYYTNYAAITFYYAHPGYRVLANAQNACGTTYAETSIYIEDCYYYSISPNPASDIATITRVLATEDTNGKTTIMKSDGENTNCDIQILDYYGSLQYQAKKSGDSFTIPVNNLKDGNYTVKITNGNKTSNLKLVVKH